MNFDELTRKRIELQRHYEIRENATQDVLIKCDLILEDIYKIIEESNRVILLADNVKKVLDDLDAEFESQTSLNKLDMTFLFLAVALQCARQYILANDKFRLTSKEGDIRIKKIIPKQWQTVLLESVPYDAMGKGTGLGGSTHRYRTLGHDPVLGWIFGPMNILSDSLTKTDFITSYSVQNMKICEMIPTIDVFTNAMWQILSDKYLLPIAVTRQAMHFGSDYFTKQGLPLPFISSIDNDISKVLVTQFNIDIYSVTRGVTVAVLINALISCIHQLFYKENEHKSHELYEAKTRKILLYSNLIATESNVILVALKSCMGDPTAFKKFDIGGIIVTLHRLITDINFIGEIKREFIKKRFNEMIRGDE